MEIDIGQSKSGWLGEFAIWLALQRHHELGIHATDLRPKPQIASVSALPGTPYPRRITAAECIRWSPFLLEGSSAVHACQSELPAANVPADERFPNAYTNFSDEVWRFRGR
ncbi:hypothetical protein M2281_004776 [Mesorhizobium soli]|uniref:hypothetical protein n=1 Tax=Pseudaminobacter soli (ex Li et al. 2025) TaxID=1295366 RepID=UPI002476E124|nr:hypothetical protein [Mesorhizobium soli]MDH6234162.1 hypothetical protein [Mesorhizobium soli]